LNVFFNLTENYQDQYFYYSKYQVFFFFLGIQHQTFT
jgi:hypothetical protein